MWALLRQVDLHMRAPLNAAHEQWPAQTCLVTQQSSSYWHEALKPPPPSPKAPKTYIQLTCTDTDIGIPTVACLAAADDIEATVDGCASTSGVGHIGTASETGIIACGITHSMC